MQISTHTPVRVWRCVFHNYSNSFAFQLTHPWGCDFPPCFGRLGIKISTHTPVRVWLYRLQRYAHSSTFQLTHPWGCDAVADTKAITSEDFNSHTREGVTKAPREKVQPGNNFNSHTREGVTSQSTAVADDSVISTHTPVRVWPWSCKTFMWSKEFQLTHPWGCDLRAYEQCGSLFGFQLTHPWGCDARSTSWICVICLFQLTHPWGCDMGISSDTFAIANFNSHTREGVTLWRYQEPQRFHISTHTPVRVWPLLAASIRMPSIFQLTHPWGCDPSGTAGIVLYAISTHTPVRVWPISSWFCIGTFIISTHTPVRVWLLQAKHGHQKQDFNSHTREGVTGDKSAPR